MLSLSIVIPSIVYLDEAEGVRRVERMRRKKMMKGETFTLS